MTHAPEARETVAYKAFRRFNAPELRAAGGVSARIDRRATDWFPSDSLPDQIVRSLGAVRAIDTKEVFESFEFFERVRRRLRRPHVADLCAGHGLTGILFATFERGVERVTLVDKRKPKSHQKVLDAVCDVAPWVRDKVAYREAGVAVTHRELPDGVAIIGVHACGARTDRCIDVALAKAGPIAVMPCCYSQTARQAPRAFRRSLGCALATDVARTYRLEAAGYDVDWSAIPSEITEMNRILVGCPPA